MRWIRLKQHKKILFPLLLFILTGLTVPKTGRLYCRETAVSPGNTLKIDRGIKNITNFHWQEYDGQPQNWSIIQDNRGIIYAANQGGLLEFDGLSWREIPIPNKTVRSLAVDKQGTIYAGGINEIGYLAPGAKGELQFVSLTAHLEEKDRNFYDVWRTHCTGEGTYFSTSKFLFLWDGEKVKVWQADSSFGAPFVCGGELYGREVGRGLLEMKGNSFELIAGGEAFASKPVSMMAPFDTQRLLIGTRSSGLYLYDGAKAVPFPTEADDYLKENQISYGIRLISSPGQFAVGTRSGGIAIIDTRGNLRTVIDKSSGLQNDKVHYIFEDSHGNLWPALNEGIAKIEYHSPFTSYKKPSGLPGIALSVAVHSPAGKLYAGTTSGLFQLTGAGAFQPLPGISSACWQLLPFNNSILMAAEEGILQIENNVKKNILAQRSFALCRSQQDKKRIWAGTIDGLVSLYLKENRWTGEYRLEGIDREIRTIVEDRQGNLWLGTRTKGVLKVDFPGNKVSDRPVVTLYDTAHGLPAGEIHVFTAAGHVMFATARGIFRFAEKKGVFIPDNTLGKEFAGGEQGKSVFRIKEDRDKNIYLHSHGKNIRALRQPDGRFILDRKPFLRLPLAHVEEIYPDPAGDCVWFASVDGLIRYDTIIKKNCDLPFRCLIRRVSVNGEPVFLGYKKGMKYERDDGSTGLYPVIDYENRNLRFEFAAPFFEAESETRYRCILKGYDKEWSPWTGETRKDYTNLDAGMNVFRVQARNVYGNISSEAVFRFRILPPWYRAWWAFVLYGAAAFLVVFLIVRRRSGQLLKDKQRLEQIVEERTAEIKEKSRQLEEQAEQLKEMDTIKSRFFANISHEFRTPLTLIMGPLEHMLSSSRLNEKEHKKNLRLMMRNSRRLLGLINRLLELSKYDSGKVELRAAGQNILPFIKGIFASFESAAGKKDLALTFHSKEEEMIVYFDAGKLEEAVSNLLSNAVKFTPAGGSVSVTVKKIHEKMDRFPAGAVTIAVRDTGPGIPVDKFDHIFDRFVQAESTHEHHHKGSGIGLAIAKEVISLHHGTIDVVNREIGTGDPGGSVFTIRLPLGRAHLKDDEIDASGGQGALLKNRPQNMEDRSAVTLISHLDSVKFPPKTFVDGSTSVEPGWHEVPAGKDFSENQAGAVRRDGTKCLPEKFLAPPFFKKVGWGEKENIILIIEDNADMRAYIRGILEPTYSVIEAGDGKQGIDTAREFIPDLIISDIMMPEVDGCELCRVLKNDRATSHIPVILLTAKAAEDNVLAGLETGADDYITKPFSTKILLARIKNLIELRRHLQETWKREMNLQPAKMVETAVDVEFIKELKEVMEKNISDTGFNVEELGRKLYMSHATLYRKIQALTGESPTDFIRSFRLKRGAELLKTTSCTVLEAAFEVGFSSTAYFTKCFKEKFHQLPSTYMNSD